MFNRKSIFLFLTLTVILAIGLGAILTLGGDDEGGETETTDKTNQPIVAQDGEVALSGAQGVGENNALIFPDGVVEINPPVQQSQQGQPGEVTTGGSSDESRAFSVTQMAHATQSNIPATQNAVVQSAAQITATPQTLSFSATPAPTQVASETEPEEPESDMDAEINPFTDPATDNLSTFSMDVDTGSYTIARNYLTNFGQLPPPHAIRPEEMINYFDAQYDGPDDGDPFAVHVDAAPSPFADDDTYLMRVGIQGQFIAAEDRDSALLIFVIDISGSMDQPNRLPLAKNALGLLVNELREDDRVGIVVYSDNSRVILDPTPASEKETILDAIGSLQNEGSTNLVAGLELGYNLAEAYQSENDGITHIILLSDGVANVGVTDPQGILENAREKASEGITLSTIGFGLGEYNDELMEQVADNGDGSYYYIDNIRQARRIFVHQLTGTLQVIAYDARIQVDFNPDIVAEYRLIGYENRAIADADFRNDAEVDAAEVGAGHSVTGLYEVRLQPNADNGNVATVYVRYQNADTSEFDEVNVDFPSDRLFTDFSDMPASFRLHAVVAEFGEMLRGTNPDGDYVELLAMATPLVDALSNDPDVAEFVDLIRLAGQYVDVGQ